MKFILRIGLLPNLSAGNLIVDRYSYVGIQNKYTTMDYNTTATTTFDLKRRYAISKYFLNTYTEEDNFNIFIDYDGNCGLISMR